MNSKFGRSAISALCVGLIFCLLEVATPAQDYPNVSAQITQSVPAQTCPQPCAQIYQQPCQASAPYPPIYTQPYPTAYSQPYTQPYPYPSPYTQPYPQYYSQSCPSPCNGDNGDKVKHAQEGSADAAEVFRDIAVVRDKIPQDVLANAVAIGVFKDVFNAAFIGGYRQGDGAITLRTPYGWSAPVFYKMKGGSFGLQFGAESTDYVLVFMSQEAIRDLADGEFDLSLDANAVAGPVFGAKVSFGHRDFPTSKTVFVYARSRGLFAGALIDGAKLYARNSVNRALYGKNARELLRNPQRTLALYATSLPPGVSDLPQTVAANVPNPQPVCVVIAQPPPMPTVAPIPYAPPVPAPVVDVFKDDEDDMLELEDQSPSRWVNSCCRVRKLKN